MKSIFSISALAAMAALAFVGTAAAADMPLKAPPPPPLPTWTGMYIGINGGYSWERSRHTDTAGVTTGDFNMKGGLGGVTYGGNWQMGHAVLGFETDFDGASITGTSGAVCAGGATCFTKDKWVSTERMRAGWDWNGWLLYGTLGAVFTRTQAGVTGCAAATFCGERTRAGWTGGVGVETMFWKNWSAKLEYLHYDTGSAINYAGITVLDRSDMVRAGINYHFDLLNLLNF